MRVLTIYAHHNPRSFCHAILQRFDEGLKAGGHSNEIIDLHKLGFDPVLSERDGPSWIDDSVPDDVLADMNVKEMLRSSARNPLRRLLVKQWIADKSDREIIRAIHAEGPPNDVVEQQKQIAQADALAFIAPIYFVGFPAILKGWIERVFTLGFAFELKPEAWRGDIRGRIPLLRHKKALIISTTLFDAESYAAKLEPAMTTLIDEFALRYPGIENIEHVYFHAVYGADASKRQTYLDRAFTLGKHFAVTKRS